MKAMLGVIGLAALVAGCTISNTPTPTTPTLNLPTPAWSLQASPTVDPLLPSGDGNTGMVVGASNPTQAGLAAEGQPSADPPTYTPAATESQLAVAVSAPDGLILQGTFFAAPSPVAPVALILRGDDSLVWDPLAARLQAAGYAVMGVDLRGYGATGGQPDWTAAPGDVRTVLAQLAGLRNVNGQQIAIIGANVGANLALSACADTPGCAAAVLLSPGLDYEGITTPDAMARLGTRPVLILAGENDANNPADSVTLDSLSAGDHRLIIVPGGGRGTELLTNSPGLVDTVAEWLIGHMPPP